MSDQLCNLGGRPYQDNIRRKETRTSATMPFQNNENVVEHVVAERLHIF